MESSTSRPTDSLPPSPKRDRRARWAAIGAAVAVSLGAVGNAASNRASAVVDSGDRPVFVPIEPCRLADTRDGTSNVGPRSTALTPAETLTVTAHGANGRCTGPSTIPNDALALSLNVTALAASEQTYLTFWGNGDNPGTANLNPAPGQPPTPNAVNTPLSSSGTFNIFNARGLVDVVIDVNGYYADHDHDDRYMTQAAFDAARPTSQLVGPVEFIPESPTTNWSLSAAHVHAASGSDECVFAPLTVPVGATVTKITTFYASKAASPTIEIGVGGTRVEATTIAGVDDFVHTIAPGTSVSVAGTAPSQFASTETNVLADAVIRPNFAYIASVCTADDFTLLGVTVDFTS